MNTTIHLVRHGEVFNPEKILYGRLEGYALSELGEEMVKATAAYLAPRDITFLSASPLLRAQQSAKPIAEKLNLPISSDSRLIEATNVFEGQRLGHGSASFANPRNWRYFLNPFKPSWGESYKQQVDRVMAAVRDAKNQAQSHEAVLVFHQLPIWLTRLHLEGKPLIHDPRKRQCALASVTSLIYAGDHLQRIEYAEPARHLYAKAIDATGGKLV